MVDTKPLNPNPNPRTLKSSNRKPLTLDPKSLTPSPTLLIPKARLAYSAALEKAVAAAVNPTL